MRPLPRSLLVVRLQLRETLSGIAPEQKEIEIETGHGGGDCGYPFQKGADYVVYAYRNAEGRLETSICSGTRPIEQAARDMEYFHVMANAPRTGELRVLTGLPGAPGKSGITIIAERDGSRYPMLTNAAGDARFTNLPPGEYKIHSESDGDLLEDPTVQLHAKGCSDITLLRFLRITGHVLTASGQPAARVEVQFRSAQGKDAGDSAMTGPDGRYQLRIVRTGQYYLGVNLNNTATSETPYPRWFYPGTEDAALAARIEFSGKPAAGTYDLTLPAPLSRREIDGVVFRRDGQPMPRAVVTVYDASSASIAQGLADINGRFAVQVFSGIPYRLEAVWPGNTPDEAFSALPTAIQPGSEPLTLRLTLTEPGNSYFKGRR